ncbi:HD domain-containing protein [uncultured Thermanaerothrix sp.]|uniref:HD domain-containing protein n=1 Tax=uncultured Thermanaerothrix sp. TaxID=1195149 RepID=UPI00260198F9|nr:HD domain-containing protein [uncultured Thermanaerothrix sp.]
MNAENTLDWSMYSADQQAHLRSALELAQACQYDVQHTHQVLRLALRLFDDLWKLHGLDVEGRFWLEMAALLHDIGWVEGRKGHHKVALQIILKTPLLLLDPRERLLIGLIARYHRKALPSLRHAHYAALSKPDRRSVRRLAALLRVADGLDVSHQSRVTGLRASYDDKSVYLTYTSPTSAPEEERAAAQKGDLLEKVYKRRLVLQYQPAF